MSEQPTIYIKPRPWGGFTVSVSPLPQSVAEDICSSNFDAHRDAYGFSVGLRMTHGWPVCDQSGEAR